MNYKDYIFASTIYKNHIYAVETDHEDDTSKMVHYIIGPSRNRLSLAETPEVFNKVGPYDFMPRQIFETAVDQILESK